MRVCTLIDTQIDISKHKATLFQQTEDFRNEKTLVLKPH